MIKKIYKKLVNRETVSYFVFGVLTTLVDWIGYAVVRSQGIDYRIATAIAWLLAVLFAYVTNKIYVFQSKEKGITAIVKELASFVTCRLATGVVTLLLMMLMVDGLKITQDFICKVIVSVVSLVLNYALSKWFIFKKERV